MATRLTATSCFDRGNYVKLADGITWDDFKVVAIQAVTDTDVPVIRIKAELTRPDGSKLECIISNLKDDDLKKIQHVAQKGKQLKSTDLTLEV